MHHDVISQEEVSRLNGDLERTIKCVQFGISQRRVSIDNISIIHVRHDVHSRAIIQEFPEVAGIILRLPETLHGDKLMDQRAIPDAAGICLAR